MRPVTRGILGKGIFALLWLAAVLGASVVSPSSATAQTPATAGESGQKLEAIRKRMESGLGLFVSGKAEEAAKTFDDGYAEYPYSAFLFNAGVCYQKLDKVDLALDRFRAYLAVDPSAPDIETVQHRIAALEAIRSGTPPVTDGTTPVAPVADEQQDVLRSLVVIETEPVGAPVVVYEPLDATAAPFELGAENASWKRIITTQTPTSLSLGVGRYQIVVEKFQDYNASDTTIDVSPGHVHHFKANLSQGAFMAFLRVAANVKGAHLYLDDKDKQRAEWGTTPYGELVPAGRHEVLIEVPGFQPLTTEVELVNGEQKQIEVNLERVNWGFLRVDADAPLIQVFVDGKDAGMWRKGEPPLDVKAGAGNHTLKVVSDGRKDFEGVVAVPWGQVQPVHAKMIPKYPRGAAWTQAIIGAGFIGAGVFFGLESENIKKQLDADQAAGILDPGDPRINQGRWYAIGADAGFAVGGVLAVLSTYNFIRDPLPESSRTLDKPVEFEDVLKQRPTAPPPPPKASAPAAQARVREWSDTPSRWIAGPSVTSEGAGFFVGGTF